MKKYILLVIIAITTSFSLFAQSDPVKVQLDHIFQYINKTQIPTGYLDEYGAQFVDKKPYNGILSDSNIIRELTVSKLIYNDISTAKINPGALSLPSIDTLNAQLDGLSPGIATPLVFHISHYDSLREDGIQQNLFTHSNNQIFDKAGRTQSPYITKTLFAACPTFPYSNNNTINLTYNPAFFYTNWNKQVSNISINFLDGEGYHPLPANGTLSKSYTDSSGYKKFAIKLVCTDGSIYDCFSGQYVDVPVTGGFANRYEILEEIDLANPLFTKELAGQYSKGKVYVRYSKKRRGTALEDSIVKPFIVVEGYDIHDVAPLLKKENYDINKLIVEWDDLRKKTGYDFNGALDDSAGYDLIFVDYYTMDSIQGNAKMLEAVIDEINLRKVNNEFGFREQNVVMGISMGGLVSRYCLAKMTKNRGRSSTDTRLLLTMDSPHQGANIPLGFQHFIYDFGEVSVGSFKFKKLNDELKQFYKLQLQPATTQQLIARVTEAGGPIAYNTFLQDGNDYRNTITFSGSDPIPSYSFKAVSQGSACAQWVMQPGTNIVDVVDNKMVALNIILWGMFKGKYRLDLKINALPAYGSSNIICDLKVERNVRFFWGLIGTGWVQTSDALPRSSPPNMIPWDCVPGGTQSASGRSGGGFSVSGTVGVFSGENFKGRTVWGWLLEGLSRPLASVTQSIDIPFNQDIFTFVPITSALDIQNATLPSFCQTHVFPVDGLAGSTSSGYIAQKKFTGTINNQSATLYNSNHTDFTARNAQWIYNEMQDENQEYDCEDFCNEDLSIMGDDNFCTTSNNYTIPGMFPGSQVHWTVSNSGIASPDDPDLPETTLAGTGNGRITLTATVTSACGVNQTLPKQIDVGKPFVDGGYIAGGVFNLMSFDENSPNIICAGKTINTQMTVTNGSAPSWSRVLAAPTNNTWSQSGNDISFYFWGVDQTATFKLTSSNNCGTTERFYAFKSINCNGGGGGDPCDQFVVSPNPAVSNINIYVPNKPAPCDDPIIISKNGPTVSKRNITQVKLFDNTGNLKKQQSTAKTKQLSMNISGLTPGIYFLEISDGAYKERQKVVIQ